jgi:hypothetical protein
MATTPRASVPTSRLCPFTSSISTQTQNNSFISVPPAISVDIPDLEEYKVETENQHLSLTVRNDESTLSTSNGNVVKSPLLDLQKIDFLGPAEVIKKLFRLHQSADQPYFALHRMGNTLLVDSLVGIDEQEEKVKTNEPAPDVAVFSPDRPMNSLIGNMSATTAVSNFMCGLPEPQSHISHDTVLEGGSPYLPPPGYFFPQYPPVLPFRNIFNWKLHNLNFAVGSDLLIYNPPDRPALTVVPIDMTKEIPLSTCLDHYLDNVMANVPELALCLHAKGFLRGISVCGTEDIPHLTSMLQSDCLTSSNMSGTIDHLPSKKSKKKNNRTPLFDPQVIELNALTILKFLQQNCSKEDGTYIVQVTRKPGHENSSPPDSIQIYDLQAMSLSGQRKWKWLLAMLSHRFATRLGHHFGLASPQSRVILRDRQLSLYQSCYDLLLQIRHLGGGDHGSICAAVLEHIADIHQSRAEMSHQKKNRNESRFVNGGTAETINNKKGDEKRKKKSKKKHQNKTEINFSPTCDLQPSSYLPPESDFQDDELESIDYSLEIEKCLELFLRAMSDLGNVITSQLSDAVANSSENSNSILIGDVPCDTSESLDLSDSIDKNSSATPVNLMLVIQYSGLFHKAISSCMAVIKNTLSSSITRQGSTKLAIAMRYLDQIVPYCKQWISVTSKIKQDLVSFREQNEFISPSKNDSISTNLQTFNLTDAFLSSENSNPTVILEENIQDMWSIDRTILDDLPMFWDTLGEICREMSTMKPNKEEAQDLANLEMQLEDWRSSILILEEIALCLTQMSEQASSLGPRDCSLKINEIHPYSIKDIPSLWVILSGREWASEQSPKYHLTLKTLFKMLVPMFDDHFCVKQEPLSMKQVDLSLGQSSVRLLKVKLTPLSCLIS